jgi:hypothetical protein
LKGGKVAAFSPHPICHRLPPRATFATMKKIYTKAGIFEL